MAAVHDLQRRPVIAVVRVHGTDHAEIVDSLRYVRKYLTYFEPGLAMALELPRGTHECPTRPVRTNLRPGHWLAIILRERRLRVEGVHLRHSAVQEQKDDVFRPGCEMRLA